MQKIASLDASLLGRSDPRLFVREIEKRSSDLCKRMQVASAAAVAAARRGPAVTESENCCPGGGSRLLFPSCPLMSLSHGLPSNRSTPLSLSSFRFTPRRASSFRKLRDIEEEAKRKKPDDVYE